MSDDAMRAAGFPVVPPDPDGAAATVALWHASSEPERSADRLAAGVVDVADHPFAAMSMYVKGDPTPLWADWCAVFTGPDDVCGLLADRHPSVLPHDEMEAYLRASFTQWHPRWESRS